MLKATPAFLLACSLALAAPSASPQSAPVSANLPAFDAVTIKPPNPENRYQKMGFYGEVGGRIFFGGNIRMLAENAFNLQDYQVAGGPDWTTSQWFEINAVPPEGSPSHAIAVRNAEPTPDQRLMLQSLLRDRFHFKSHFETKEGEVYILTRGKKPLQLRPPEHPAEDPRAIVVMRDTGIDGEAFGTNTTTDYLALSLSRYLKLPVSNQTGIAGSYDFNLPPIAPENQDIVAATLSVVDRLGLKIHRGRGPIQTLLIDHVEQPTEN
jgi:uncharacterized protein (TIGR03435 family)